MTLNDGHLSIDNNAAERQIRPFTIGRKNWLFMGSVAGAKAASVIYSLIETAKANGLNPTDYLKISARTNSNGVTGRFCRVLHIASLECDLATNNRACSLRKTRHLEKNLTPKLKNMRFL